MLRRAELAREISSLESTAGYRDIVGLQIELLHYEPFAERIWELRFNLTTYDAWYVACAEALAVPLATLDAPPRAGAGAPRADSCCPTTVWPHRRNRGDPMAPGCRSHRSARIASGGPGVPCTRTRPCRGCTRSEGLFEDARVAALVGSFFRSYGDVATGSSEAFVPLDEGLAIISRHALLPVIEHRHGLSKAEAEARPKDDRAARALRADDRLAKTLLNASDAGVVAGKQGSGGPRVGGATGARATRTCGTPPGCRWRRAAAGPRPTGTGATRSGRAGNQRS